MRRSQLGVVFQSYNLVPALTAADNISLPLRLGGRPIDPVAVQEVADRLGVGGVLGQRPAELSGGEQQRVALARALITHPDLVVADEPTGALDTGSAEAVLGVLRSIVADVGQRVLMVTHDVTAASAADRVLFLSDGRWRGELRGGSRRQIAEALATIGRPT
jgi:putative ABC transport system ATP-binding protein